jgi:probable F420-dependent oxidoreductase
MKYGVSMFPTHDAIDPGSLAQLAEAAGFESLFFPDHSHIPAGRQTPFPGGGELGREYSHTLDLFVALTAAAAATTELRVGSGVCLLTQRDPITCAKQTASIDHLSNGRLIFGVGAGWNAEEMANHGTDPRTRFALLQERVEAVRAIWSHDEASYHGRFVDFDGIWSWPKPVQEPHPPILLAGNGPSALDRVLAYADGWAPLPEPGLGARIEELLRRAGNAGRDVTVTVFGAALDARDLDAYAADGVERCVFGLPPSTACEVERVVEEVRSVIAEVGA